MITMTMKKTTKTCIQVLLPALIEKPEQEAMTSKALNSIFSLDHCVKVTIDNNYYDARIAGVWNKFFDYWRGKDYSYLMITANDVEHDPNCIDYLVKHAEANPDAGIISAKVTRDHEEFKRKFGLREYVARETIVYKDPATFLIRKGVIEAIGRVDEWFPLEFVERDFIYRAKLAGFKWLQPDVELVYHPTISTTIGNDNSRLTAALRKYATKWGGDAEFETFKYPFNDLNLDFTYCYK